MIARMIKPGDDRLPPDSLKSNFRGTGIDSNTFVRLPLPPRFGVRVFDFAGICFYKACTFSKSTFTSFGWALMQIPAKVRPKVQTKVQTKSR